MFRSETKHTARKAHRCDYCRGTIPAGTAYLNISGKWQGDFYSARGHTDCRDLWLALYDEYADHGEGMAFDLPEVISDLVSPPEAQESLDAQRGYFPHAVNRIEWSLRRWLADDDAEDSDHG